MIPNQPSQFYAPFWTGLLAVVLPVLAQADVVTSLLFTAVSFRSETKTRRVENLLTITANHREAWKVFLSDKPWRGCGGLGRHHQAAGHGCGAGLLPLGSIAGSRIGGTLDVYAGAVIGGLIGELGGAAGTTVEPGGGTVAGGLAGAGAGVRLAQPLGEQLEAMLEAYWVIGQQERQT